jgi:hypothetical protein
MASERLVRGVDDRAPVGFGSTRSVPFKVSIAGLLTAILSFYSLVAYPPRALQRARAREDRRQ